MGASFFIPKRINVGYQERQGTYTGKLAYIIYFDEKGKLRKEASWNGWRDKKIDNDIYENEPTSGFVLNKKAGGYDTGWNHRQTYVRVYDPRGFEFEITVPNLLYILENATSTKGKGLEGEFVYGWDGKDLVLVPVDSPDYKELVKLNELRHSKSFVKAKELKIGATYRNKENQELIYIGKFDEYNWNGTKKSKPQFYFYKRSDSSGYFETMATISQKLVEMISEEPVADYAEIFEQLERDTKYSPIDESKTVYIPYSLEEFEEKFNNSGRWVYVFSDFDNVDKKMERQNVYGGHGENKDKFGYYKREWQEHQTRYSWETTNRYISSVHKYVDTLQELFDIVKPMKKVKYLANGKLHGEASY